ncbi:MAG: hypothetical protein PHD61_05525 [Bacteroidales bacterium]|nr:hypothetical protein [Lentimicrobiaceae bacterium]MDD5694746.1 hypothetical protein [Bacteroidales bacterium]
MKTLFAEKRISTFAERTIENRSVWISGKDEKRIITDAQKPVSVKYPAAASEQIPICCAPFG